MRFPRIISWLCVILMSACAAPAPGLRADPTTLVPSSPSPLPVIFTPSPAHSYTPVPADLLPAVTPTPESGSEDLAEYYDGLVITLDYVGQTIQIILGQGILMRLGDEFIWSIEIEPADVLTINQKITPEPGEQGVFIARKKGKATITAVGSPLCSFEDPPCLRPSVLFQMVVDVK